MAIDRTELHEMARHRGLTLKASRRRKPGGDFGKYGLEDATGRAVLGIGKAGLEASDEEVAAYLRNAARADWKTSAGSTPARKAPRAEKPVAAPKPRAAAPPKPAPAPKPRFRPEVVNLFDRLPSGGRTAATTLLDAKGARVSRIVAGSAPWADTGASDEWLLLVSGAATIRIADSEEVELKPGDQVTVAAGQRRVLRGSGEVPAVLLALRLPS